jgi:hypothetical protein
MYYSDAIREAARRADEATRDAIAAHEDDTLPYEPHITSGLATLLRKELNGEIEGLLWTSHVMKSGSGSGAEETPTGADLLVHVAFNTPELKYSKGVLIQAKRVEPGQVMDKDPYNELVDQCEKMLAITAASFVFDYAKGGMRCGAASAIAKSKNRELYEQCMDTVQVFPGTVPMSDRRFENHECESGRFAGSE